MAREQIWENNATAIAATVQFIADIAHRYGSEEALLGISLLNEPTVPAPLQPLPNRVPVLRNVLRILAGVKLSALLSGQGHTLPHEKACCDHGVHI